MTEPPARQILVATDFSDSAEAALGVAVRDARELHARLHLLHVFWEGEVEVTQLLADAAAQAVPSGLAPAVKETASSAMVASTLQASTPARLTAAQAHEPRLDPLRRTAGTGTR